MGWEGEEQLFLQLPLLLSHRGKGGAFQLRSWIPGWERKQKWKLPHLILEEQNWGWGNPRQGTQNRELPKQGTKIGSYLDRGDQNRELPRDLLVSYILWLNQRVTVSQCHNNWHRESTISTRQLLSALTWWDDWDLPQQPLVRICFLWAEAESL